MADEQKTPDGISRRRFLSVVGVSSAGAAALSGCSTDKVEKLIPYLVQSEDQVPGIPTIYASTCTECSAGCGLHVVTREAPMTNLLVTMLDKAGVKQETLGDSTGTLANV